MVNEHEAAYIELAANILEHVDEYEFVNLQTVLNIVEHYKLEIERSTKPVDAAAELGYLLNEFYKLETVIVKFNEKPLI